MRKVVLIGIDGADWQVISPLLREDKLPTFKRLIKNGLTAILYAHLFLKPSKERKITSEIVFNIMDLEKISEGVRENRLYDPVCWTTLATGVSPEKHAIKKYTRDSSPWQTTVPISRRERKAVAVWEF